MNHPFSPSPARQHAHHDVASGFSSHFNDSGTVVIRKVDPATERARQRGIYHAGRVLAFIAPILVPVIVRITLAERALGKWLNRRRKKAS